MNKPTQLSHAFLTCQVLHLPDHFGHPPLLESYQDVNFLPVLGSSLPNTILQIQSHERQTQGKNPIPCPPSCTLIFTSQEAAGHLYCKAALLTLVQLVVLQGLQAFQCNAAFLESWPPALLCHGLLRPEHRSLHLPWTSWGGIRYHHQVLIFSACWGPCPPAYQPLSSVWYRPRPCWDSNLSHHPSSLKKYINQSR